MAIKDLLSPGSSDQIILVVVLWSLIALGLTQFYNTSLARFGFLIGTLIIILWIGWATFYRLKQIQQEWYRSNR